MTLLSNKFLHTTTKRPVVDAYLHQCMKRAPTELSWGALVGARDRHWAHTGSGGWDGGPPVGPPASAPAPRPPLSVAEPSGGPLSDPAGLGVGLGFGSGLDVAVGDGGGVGCGGVAVVAASARLERTRRRRAGEKY